MKTIPYSIVCEDPAHYFFVKQILLLHSTADIHFDINEDCFRRFKYSTKKEVLDGYVDIANQAFRQFPIKLLIVMIDHDDKPKETFSEYHKELSEEIFANIKDQVVIAIPVRCIEHWLRYLQWNKENPDSTKNESMEDEKRPDSKLKVYGSKKPSKDKAETVIKELLKAKQITWLASRSASFNHFYEQVKKLSSH